MPIYVTIPLVAAGILLSLVLLGFLIYLFVLVRPHGRSPADASLLCDYAHRGLHGDGVPENSLEAFRRAADAGVGIELDVQLSRDGEVMVFHDDTLSRMTESPKHLSELTAAELTALSLGGTNETIPTFRDVLAAVNGRVPILVELKGENTNTALCSEAAALLNDYAGAYCIESFNPLLLRAMKKCLPHAFCGLLYTNVVREKKKASLLNMMLTVMAFNCLCRPNFIAYHEVDRHTLPVKLTTGLYRAPKFVWTVRTEASLRQARESGETAIFETIRPPVR